MPSMDLSKVVNLDRHVFISPQSSGTLVVSRGSLHSTSLPHLAQNSVLGAAVSNRFLWSICRKCHKVKSMSKLGKAQLQYSIFIDQGTTWTSNRFFATSWLPSAISSRFAAGALVLGVHPTGLPQGQGKVARPRGEAARRGARGAAMHERRGERGERGGRGEREKGPLGWVGRPDRR